MKQIERDTDIITEIVGSKVNLPEIGGERKKESRNEKEQNLPSNS